MIYDRKKHWEDVYTKKILKDVSWYQVEPTISLNLIKSTRIDKAGKIIDVGGGASVLVDKLLVQGFQNLTVLDISSKSLDHAKERLGKLAAQVSWIEADVTEFDPPQKYDIWHDRAVFHFLTDPNDRKKYVQNVEKALNPKGHVIIAAFAIEGPLKCSGLDVERYSSEKMKNELGDSFEFIKSIEEVHKTPWEVDQKFIYCHFNRIK